MSLKNARSHLRQPAAWSIAARTTLLLVLCTSVVLVLATQTLYWQMARALRLEDRRFADGVVETIRLILQQHGPDARYLAVEVETESTARDQYRYYARIIGPSQNIVIQTSGMDAATPSADSGLWHKQAGADIPHHERWNPRGDFFFLLTSLPCMVGEQPFTIQFAMDVTHTEAILQQYARNIVFVLLSGITVAALLGLFLVRLSLRPLMRITDAVQQMTAAKLHGRITTEGWPAELAVLAGAFDDMFARLEDSFTRLTQFSADLAHELRTPVNNIRGQAEVALARSRDASEYREALASNLEETERLTRTIENLLFLARCEHAKSELALAELDVAAEARSVAEYAEPMAAEKKIELSVTGTGHARADSLLLRRAILNLVMNAIHHTRDRGRIEVHADEDGDFTRLSVSDSGAGIASQHLPRLFDRFYRVDSSRTGDTRHAGLGLAIVKSIADLHRGRVTVESQPGRGSVFTLHLPRVPST
jgi:two-component system, OmpR family, heavy metal sensor histidine kinase CusS